MSKLWRNGSTAARMVPYCTRLNMGFGIGVISRYDANPSRSERPASWGVKNLYLEGGESSLRSAIHTRFSKKNLNFLPSFATNVFPWGIRCIIKNKVTSYSKEVTIHKLMASTNKKQTSPSPAAQRKTQKTNKVNLHAEKNDEITVVGIGASAGGLKALQEFFEALPSSTGMAYVVITHLHPEHESHLAELLQTR